MNGTKRWGKWRRLYIAENGSFARLPWLTRAAAGQLLKATDDEGRIEVGTLKEGGTLKESVEQLVAAIAFRHGATTGDKRIMRTAFEELAQDGYLVRSGSHWCVRNFGVAQIDKVINGNEPETNPKRTTNEPRTNRERTANEKCPNPAKPITSRPVDKIREEEEKTKEIPPPSPPPKDLEPKGSLPKRTRMGADELASLLGRSSGGVCNVSFGTNREVLRSIGVVADQIEAQGRDSAAEFAALGEAFKAGVVQQKLRAAPSLLQLLGKPQEDGTRSAAALVTALDFAMQWKRAEEKKRAELEASRNTATPEEISDCEQREVRAQAALAVARLAKLKAEADAAGPVKPPVRPRNAGPLFGMPLGSTTPPPVDSRPPSARN